MSVVLRVSINDVVVVMIIAESTVVVEVFVVKLIVDLLSIAGVRLSHDCFRPLKIVPVE